MTHGDPIDFLENFTFTSLRKKECSFCNVLYRIAEAGIQITRAAEPN